MSTNNNKNDDDDDDDTKPFIYEDILLTLTDVCGYQVPPRTTARGYSAEDLKRQQIWDGSVRVRTFGNQAFIELISRDGNLFASCPLHTQKTVIGESVERTIDSSRYFVLRIVSSRDGRVAHVGIGLRERSQAFDLMATLTDWQERRQRSEELSTTTVHPSIKNTQSDDDHLLSQPFKDLSLKGPIRINIKGKTDNNNNNNTSSTNPFDDIVPSTSSSATTTTMTTTTSPTIASSNLSPSNNNDSLLLAPPPSSNRTRPLRKS
jgi:hypothetical protein